MYYFQLLKPFNFLILETGGKTNKAVEGKKSPCINYSNFNTYAVPK